MAKGSRKKVTGDLYVNGKKIDKKDEDKVLSGEIITSADKPLASPAAPGQSFEDFTAQQVAKYNVTDARIAELKELYGGITVTDEDTYKKAKEAKRVLVPLRTGVEAVRKDLKAVALEYGRKIDAEAKRITGELESIEDQIDKEIKAWDEKAEIERQRIENQKIERAKNWIATVLHLGVQYNHQTGQYYYFDQENRPILNLTIEEIKELSDAEIAFLTENLQASFKIEQDRQAEEERLRKEEADRQEAQRIENERIAEENRIAAEKLANEKREIEEALYEARSAKLVAAGFFPVSDNVADILVFYNPSGKVTVLREEIVGVDKATWAETEQKVLAEVERLKKIQSDRVAEEKRKAEEAERLRLENERIENERKEAERKETERLDNLWNLRKAVLIAAGFEFDGNNYFVGDFKRLDKKTILACSDADFDNYITSGKLEIARLAQVAADKKKADEEAERQRLLDQGTDKEKITAFLGELGKLIVPEVKTKWANQVTDGLREMLHKANAWATEQIAKKK